MIVTSLATKLTIDVICTHAGHDWPAAVANNLYLNDIRFKKEGETLEVEDLPAVLEQMNAFLGFLEYNYYGVDELIDGRLEFRFSVRDKIKRSNEPEPYVSGHYLGVFRPTEADILWKAEGEYTKAWMEYALAYLNGAEGEEPDPHPEGNADSADVLDEMLRLLSIPSDNIGYTVD
ncbi:MAG: hypothetical protein IKX10_08320 [Lachnospiraceae bacterium]|jgi:hypothetical protein|nr:hypothetical protein [Lachnospiraceae bacterium]